MFLLLLVLPTSEMEWSIIVDCRNFRCLVDFKSQLFVTKRVVRSMYFHEDICQRCDELVMCSQLS